MLVDGSRSLEPEVVESFVPPPELKLESPLVLVSALVPEAVCVRESPEPEEVESLPELEISEVAAVSPLPSEPLDVSLLVPGPFEGTGP